MPSKHKKFFGVIFWSLFFIALPKITQAVPPPPSVEKLCESANLIILGQEVGGEVGKPEGCQFVVTFHIKPEKIYKGKKELKDAKDLTKTSYEKTHFLNLPWCQRIPGPNALPYQFESRFAKPPQEKKLLFIKTNSAGKKEIANYFYGEVDWEKADTKWRKEFEKTPSCHDEKK